MISKRDVINFNSIYIAIIFLLIWEFSSRLGFVNALFVSSPSEIAAAEMYLIYSGKLWPYFLTSMTFLLTGLSLALFIGFFIGLFIGSYKKVDKAIMPFILILNAMPMIAVMPLLILWFGIGFTSKIIIVFMLSIVPIIMNTVDGVKNTDEKYIYMAKSFGADQYFIISEIFFHNTLPYVFSGFRNAIGRGVVGVVIADLFGASNGLGYLISLYGGMFQTSKVMAVLLILLSITLTLTFLTDIMEKRIINYN
jgi:NitT/TauT family transport system permease protein